MAQNNVRTGQPEDFMRIQDLFYLCLSKWYWFVISLGITLSVAILYVLVTPPVYMRSAALLIKDESKGQSLSGEVGGSFSDLGLFQANTNVNNELISLQSPAIMLDVVNRLRLDVAYHTDGAFYRKVLYGQDLPVSVSFADLQDNESVSFTLRLLDEENVEKRVAFEIGDIIFTFAFEFFPDLAHSVPAFFIIHPFLTEDPSICFRSVFNEEKRSFRAEFS